MNYIIKLIGREKDVFAMFKLLAKTKPMKTNITWWAFKLWQERN